MKLGVLVGLLAYASTLVDVERLGETVGQVGPLTLCVFMLSGTLSRITTAVRWWWVCRDLMPEPPRVRTLFAAGLRGQFVNLFLPASVGGELTRIGAVVRHSDRTRAAWSVGLDRVLGLLGVVGALIPLSFVGSAPVPSGTGGIVGLALAAAVLGSLWSRRRLAARWARAAPLASIRVRRTLAALVFSAAAPWWVVGGYAWVLSEVQPLPLAEVGLFVLVTRFGRAVPLSVLGLGTVEGAMVGLGASFGLSPETIALTVALNYGQKLFHAGLGGVWMIVRSAVRSRRH